jgi:hypothetical protein
MPRPPNVITDFQFDASTVYSDSTSDPLSGSGSGRKGTKATSVTSSPTLARGAGSALPSPQQSNDRYVPKLDIGWPGLAQDLARNPGQEAFPRFRELNVKNLLYYQVEITALELQLREIEWEDHRSTESRNQYAKKADILLFEEPHSDDTQVSDSKVHAQRQIVYKLRKLLRDYSKAATNIRSSPRDL